MPRDVELKLKKQAKKKGLTGEAYKAYLYGTLNKIKKHESKDKD